MRLTLKLTVGILLGVWLTQMLNLVLRVQRESELLEDDIHKDHVILGRALAVDLMEEWRSRGRDAAFELSRRMNAERDAINLVLVEHEAVDAAAAGAVGRGDVSQTLRIGEDDKHLVTWVPLVSNDEVPAALRLEESLAPAHAYIRTTLWRAFTYAVLGTIASTALAFAFGFILVGLRVRALVAKARRVGDGDLSGPLDERGQDELSVLAREVNAMCERLAAARLEVERASAQRLAAVQQLRHADRLSTVGMLAAGIAHELGTPLNIVAGRSRLIADAPDAPDAIVRSAHIIDDQAQRMTRIVRQLLDFARARRPDKASIDVSRVARDTVEMLAPLAGKRGVELALDVADAIPRVCADAGQLQQAVTNLVMNAVQASRHGDRVEVRVAPRVPAGAECPEAVIAVVDHGAGMNEAQLENIFTPFFTTKDVGEGTGLGLAVAWGLVQENGGRISVQSAAARGSTFTIHLPSQAHTETA